MSEWSRKRVVVVMGGDGSEREISLRTGRAFERALVSRGVSPVVIDLTRDRLGDLIAAQPDVVLVAMHGKDGEDGSLQGLLELLGLPYTGSGVRASALAIDKHRSKCVFRALGVRTPDWVIVEGGAAVPELPLPTPVVVKPALEGSSVGITMLHAAAEWPAAWEAARHARGAVLVEQLIEGRELTVGVFGDEVMGVMEILPADGFYGYEAKYERGDTRYVYPAEVGDAIRDRVAELGLAAYRALGCRGVARVDVMLDRSHVPWVLEVNTVPGMTETSLIPKIAKGNGRGFGDLVFDMLSAATTDDRADTGEVK